MRHFFATAAILAFSAGSALSAEPFGDWLVKDGYAHIRIDNCVGKLWGIVVWEKEPGFDSENPDPAKKSRPTLGMPVLMGLVPTKPNKWEGQIYNSQNGKLYSANISMIDDNTLELEGCLFPNFMCLAQNWTRVKIPPANAAQLPPLGSAALPTKSAPVKGTKNAPPPQSEVCARVAADSTGSINGGVAKQVK